MPAKRSPTQPADVFSPDSLGGGFSQPRRRPGGRAATVDVDMAPLTAGSPVSRGLMLSSPRPPGSRVVADASFATPRQTPPSQQEGQGGDMGTPADMCFSVANTQPRRNILTTVQRAALSSDSPTEETQDSSSTPFSSSLIEASFIDMEAPSTSVRSSGVPSSSQVIDATPLASQESAYSNMYVDRPHMSQARDLEVLLSQVPNQASSSSTPFSPSRTLEEEMPATPAGPSLPQPPRRPAPTNVLSQRDPNATPLHVQLARVAEPQTCSQGAKGHAELIRDYTDEFAIEDDDGEIGSDEDGRALFASPVQAALDTLSALREPSAPAALRRHNNDVDEDAPLTQIVEAGSNNSPPTPPVVGSKRSRSSSKRHPSPEPISSTQRHRDDGAEWSRLARQFFEFIDSRPELKTIEVPPPTAAAGVRRAH